MVGRGHYGGAPTAPALPRPALPPGFEDAGSGDDGSLLFHRLDEIRSCGHASSCFERYLKALSILLVAAIAEHFRHQRSQLCNGKVLRRNHTTRSAVGQAGSNARLFIGDRNGPMAGGVTIP